METQVTLRVGKIRYLNCLPFYFGLEEKFREKGLTVSFLETHPAAINQAMRKGELDAAPISSFEYLQHQEDYFLLPELGIGARLFARSVLLISRKKIEQLDHAVIALSEESLSSASLLRVLLKQKYGFTNSFEVTKQDPETMLRQYPAALLIGDGALFCQPKDMVYKYDLGALWQAWTGKPFVFAVWAVRKEFAERCPEGTRLLTGILAENLSRNLKDPEALLKQALEIGPEDKKFCSLLGYLANLSYVLDPEMKEGLVRFFELSCEAGLVSSLRPLEFFPHPVPLPGGEER